jgi:hypothetical protein
MTPIAQATAGKPSDRLRRAPARPVAARAANPPYVQITGTLAADAEMRIEPVSRHVTLTLRIDQGPGEAPIIAVESLGDDTDSAWQAQRRALTLRAGVRVRIEGACGLRHDYRGGSGAIVLVNPSRARLAQEPAQ